jgi:hypothetical protein
VNRGFDWKTARITKNIDLEVCKITVRLGRRLLAASALCSASFLASPDKAGAARDRWGRRRIRHIAELVSEGGIPLP